MALYQLTVTGEQAAILRDACELLARCRLGQIVDACQEVLDEQGRAAVPYEIARHCESLCKAAAGLGVNASWGVGKHRAADLPFDLYQVIRYRLAWDCALEEGRVQPGEARRWPDMMGVCFDEPLFLTPGPHPEICKVE